MAELESRALRGNKLFLESVQSSGDAVLDEASYAKTKQELDAGIMLGPRSAEELPDFVKVVSMSFRIWEHYGARGARKCRNIVEMFERTQQHGRGF